MIGSLLFFTLMAYDELTSVPHDIPMAEKDEQTDVQPEQTPEIFPEEPLDEPENVEPDEEPDDPPPAEELHAERTRTGALAGGLRDL